MAQSAQTSTALTAASLFKDLVWGGVTKLVTSELITLIPFLGLGPMGLVTGVIVSIVMNMVFNILQGIYDFEAIGITNEVHRKAFEDASVSLKIIAKEKGIDSPEFSAAREKHRAALSTFIQFHSPN